MDAAKFESVIVPKKQAVRAVLIAGNVLRGR
jgi:hypothetical protein